MYSVNLSRRLFCKSTMVMAASVSATARGLQPIKSPLCQAPLTASFVQLLSVDLQRNKQAWHQRLMEWRSLGIRRLYLQWLKFNTVDFTAPRQGGGPSVLEYLLMTAEDLGLDLYLGLSFNPKLSQQVFKTSNTADPLRQIRAEDFKVVRKAAQLAVTSPAFAGWYLPLEINDLAWKSPERTRSLANHLYRSNIALQELTPNKRVTASCYVSGVMQPAAFEIFINAIWPHENFAFLLQDGVGAGFQTTTSLRPYLSAMEQVAIRLKASWGVIIELFEQVVGSPISNKKFHSKPAPLSRIKQQIATTQHFSQAERIAFTIPDYMSFSSNPAAAALAKAYLRDFC